MSFGRFIFAAGAETNDEAFLGSRTTASITSASAAYTGAYGYRLAENDILSIDLTGLITNSQMMIVHTMIRVSDSTPTSDREFFRTWDTTNGESGARIGILTDGKIRVYNADGTTNATSTNAVFSDNTWHHMTFAMSSASNTIDRCYIYFDDELVLSTTNLDGIPASGSFIELFEFLGTEASADGITTDFDDIVVWSSLGNTTIANNPFGTEILRHFYGTRVHSWRSTKASATPDSPGTPTTLNSGNWSDAFVNNTTIAAYTGGVSYGGVTLDDAGGSAGTGGPNTDTEVGERIMGHYFGYRASRSGGGGTAQWALGYGSNTSTTAGASAASGTLNVSTQMSTASGGMSINSTGTRIIICDGVSGSGICYQYNLSTAWDLSTGSYSSNSLDPSSLVSGFPAMEVSADGSTVYITDAADSQCHEYALSTAWDLSSASFTQTTNGVGKSICVAPNGELYTRHSSTSAYVQGGQMSTAFDSSTASVDSLDSGVNVGPTGDTSPGWLRYDSKGHSIIFGSGSQTLSQIHLTIPYVGWSTNTATGDAFQTLGAGQEFDPYTDATTIGSACFGNDGAYLYVIASSPSSSGNGLMKRFDLSEANSAWNTSATTLLTRMDVSPDMNLSTSATWYAYPAYIQIPRKNEYVSMGFRKDGGGQDFEMEYMVNNTISIEGIQITNVPRNVTQNRGNAGDLSEMQLAGQTATVTKATPRNVTCTTEVLTMPGTDATTTPLDRAVKCYSERIEIDGKKASVDRKKTITGKTARPKKWKALPWSEWWVDGHTGIFGSHDAATIGNALDQDLGTYYDPDSYQWPQVQGVENMAPQSSATALPAGIKIRWYVSGNAGGNTRAAYAGWRPNKRSEAAGNTFDAWEHIGTIETTGSGSGNWTEWLDFNLPYNVSGRSTGSYPYSWNDIQEYLTVEMGSIGGGNVYVHGVQVLVEEAEPANFVSGYVDASEGWEDDLGKWTNQSNAWDGSTATFASTERGSTTTWVDSYLTVAGNTLSQGVTEEEIKSVWFRANLRGQYDANNPFLTCIIYPYHPDYYDWSGDDVKFPVIEESLSGYNTQYFAAPDDTDIYPLFDFAATNTSFWTQWYKLDYDRLHADFAGTRNWKSWDELARMGFRLYRGIDPDNSTTLEISKVEYLVLAEPPNTDRKGGKAKIDRGVTGGVEVLEWDGTTYPATISSSSPRNVTCTTEAISFTESASTVDKVRGVTCTTEAVSMASTGSVTRVRGVVGLTEAITMPATGSLNLARGVSSSPEALQLAEVASTINASRVTSGVTEVLSSTSAGTNVDTARGVAGVSQSLVLAEQQGTVNAARNKVSPTEQITMPGTLATISTSTNLDVTCTTEAISFTETPAAVNGTRIAAATAEITAFVENASAVNAERSVSATTETLSLADNDSTVTRDRAFTSATEAVSLTEGSSVVDRQRGVNAGTEALSLTESLSTVTRGANLDIVATTEAISFTESAAPINRTLDIAATTEALSVVEQGAVNLQRGVNGLTEALSLTESQADITISANNRDVTCTTEVVSLTESAATVTFPRIVAGATEAITLAGVPAGVNGVRIVGSSVALSALAESGATVNLSRTVSSLTDELVMTEALASVSTSTNRIVNATTEQLSVQESSAVSNQTRGVSSSTEVLAFAEQSSSIQVLRNVVATTEQLALAEAGATVLTTRDVTGLTSSLLVAETAAQVFRGANLDVNATTSAMAFAETAAAVAFPRNVSGLTEQISLVTVPATLNRPWLVTCTTEELSFTEGLAKIDKTRTGAMPGSIIWVHPETKPVWVSD